MHYMNPQRGAHMRGESEHGGGPTSEHNKKPQIHIHTHADGHTVHIMHHDGTHEKHEHGHGDSDGIAEHIHHHLGDVGEQRPEDEQRGDGELGIA